MVTLKGMLDSDTIAVGRVFGCFQGVMSVRGFNWRANISRLTIEIVDFTAKTRRHNYRIYLVHYQDGIH